MENTFLMETGASGGRILMGKRMLSVGVKSNYTSLCIENLLGSWFGELGVATILESSAAKCMIN